MTQTKEQQKTRFLTEEYFAAFRAAAQALPVIDRAHVDAQYEVTGGPDGDVRYYLRIRRGRIEDARPGTLDAPHLSITVDYRDLVELNTGEQHAAAAFMKGVMRVGGDKAKLLELMLTLQTAVYQQMMSDLCATTEF